MPDYIAPHILRSEYECHHCHQLPPEFMLIGDTPETYKDFFETFYLIRTSWGKPIPITSGYRCPIHNRAVGGNPLSIHQWGLALDCNMDDVDEVDRFFELLEEVAPFLRIGKYKDAGTFCHIDFGFAITPSASDKWREGARWYG